MASQQQPSRPFFRLASLIRAAAPTTAPAPAPTPTPGPTLTPAQAFIRPAFPQLLRPPVGQPRPTQLEESAPPAPTPIATSPSPESPSLASRAQPVAAPEPRSPVLPSPAVTPIQPFLAPSQPFATTSVPTSPAPLVSASAPRSPTVPPPISASAPRSPIAIAPPTVVTQEARSPAPAPPPPISVGVQTSPVTKTSLSLPASPTPKSSSPTTTILPVISSLPPSPKPKVSAPLSSLPTSPAPKQSSPSLPQRKLPSPQPSPALITAAPIATSTAPASPIESKVVKPLSKSPPQSPKTRPISHPPSPLTLPPAKLRSSDTEHEYKTPVEPEKKIVLVQETIEKPRIMPKASNSDQESHVAENHCHKGMQNKKRDMTKDKGLLHKKPWHSEEFGQKVITIAGENKGAIMELSPARNKQEFGDNHRRLLKKDNPRASNEGRSSGDEEGKSKMRDRNHKAMAMQSQPGAAFMNSNVQGVNNSIIYNSSCNHSDPGVRLSLSRKANSDHRISHKE